MLRAAIAEHIDLCTGRRPGSRGELTVDDVVTVILALSNGLALEYFVDPDSVSDDLFGRILTGLAREG